jgi:hypothetical protein
MLEIPRATCQTVIDRTKFNRAAHLPSNLRLQDFEIAM